jgi:hypothetical protein
MNSCDYDQRFLTLLMGSLPEMPDDVQLGYIEHPEELVKFLQNLNPPDVRKLLSKKAGKDAARTGPRVRLASYRHPRTWKRWTIQGDSHYEDPDQQ